MSRGRRWIKEKKKALKEKVKAMTKSEKMSMIKAQLDIVSESYNGLLNIRPDIEKRIGQLEKEERDDDLLKLWKNVLKEINLLEKRPKALKPRYVNGIMKNIRKIRQKYPSE